MRVIYFSLGIIIATLLVADTKSIQTVFAHKKNEALYWQALLQVAHGDKEGALKTITHANNAVPEASFAWQSDRPESIDHFFDRLFLDSVMYSPGGLTFLGLFESIGINEHNRYLDDASLETCYCALERDKKNYAALQTYHNYDFSRDQKVSYDTFLWELQQSVAGEPFLFHSYVLTQFRGIVRGIPYFLTGLQKIESANDVECYIARLCGVPHKIQQTMQMMSYQEEHGIVPPRFALEKVVESIKRSTPDEVKTCLFYEHIENKIGMLQLSNAQELLMHVKNILEQEVYPAYRALCEHCSQMLERVHDNNGVWALPNGDAYYAYMLKGQTTTDMTPDEIHALGLQEVAKIHAHMREVLAREGLDDPDKGIFELLQVVSQDGRFYYPNTEEGRTQCIADFESILERSRRELGHLFGLKPQTSVAVYRIPAHEENGAAGAYYARPSFDGARGGQFRVNLRDMAEMPTYSMETLAIHEGEPGHHFQIAIQTEADIPILRKLGSYVAHAEGWALYAEKLAYEHGFYSSSFAQLGHLLDELLRAVRLVIDTGIHHKRWTREYAIDYMQEVTGFHRNSVITEVERYFVLPGQACGYKIGQLKLLELRKRAQDALGDQFDIRAFHDLILRTASVPLMVLEDVVNRYIKETLSA